MRRIAIATALAALALVLALTAPVALWPDTDLDPGAAAWLTAKPPRVADDRNLFNGLAGFSLPGDRDFVAAGADLVAKTNRALAMGTGDAAWAEMPEWDPPGGDESLDDLCVPTHDPCAQRWRERPGEATALAAAHRDALARLDRLPTLPEYAMTVAAHPDAPMLDYFAVILVYRLRLNEIGEACAAGDAVAALVRLDAAAVLARRLLVDAQLLLTKMIAVAMLQENLYTLAACFDLRPETAAARAPVAALDARERSLRHPMASEFRYTTALFDQGLAPLDVTKSGTDIEVPRWAVGWILKRNRTVNRAHRVFAAIADLSEMPAGEAVRGMPARLAALEPPALEFLVNPVGAILMEVARPEIAPYVVRINDVDGLIGLVNAERVLVADAVPDDRIAEVLADAARIADRSPYDGAPFTWDPGARTIGFESPGSRPASSRLAHASPAR